MNVLKAAKIEVRGPAEAIETWYNGSILAPMLFFFRPHPSIQITVGKHTLSSPDRH